MQSLLSQLEYLTQKDADEETRTNAEKYLGLIAGVFSYTDLVTQIDTDKSKEAQKKFWGRW